MTLRSTLYIIVTLTIIIKDELHIDLLLTKFQYYHFSFYVIVLSYKLKIFLLSFFCSYLSMAENNTTSDTFVSEKII